MQKGPYKFSFNKDICTILDRNPSDRLIARVEITKNWMFPLRIDCIQGSEEVSFKTMYLDPTWLWHLRYGHLHFEGLSLLQKRNMVKGLPPIENPTNSCESCILAKQHRESFPVRSSYRARTPLELIHTNICGPMQTPSLSGSIYFLTFTDDFNRKTWIYFLKHKSEAFSKFKEFKAMVEKQSDLHIQILILDRGGEYSSNEFLDFCRDHGIKKQFTTKYTPHQNGVVERKNRNIMEMARSMLKAKNLSNVFWVEVVACVVYILNRSPTKSVKDRIP